MTWTIDNGWNLKMNKSALHMSINIYTVSLDFHNWRNDSVWIEGLP